MWYSTYITLHRISSVQDNFYHNITYTLNIKIYFSDVLSSFTMRNVSSRVTAISDSVQVLNALMCARHCVEYGAAGFNINPDAGLGDDGILTCQLFADADGEMEDDSDWMVFVHSS